MGHQAKVCGAHISHNFGIQNKCKIYFVNLFEFIQPQLPASESYQAFA